MHKFSLFITTICLIGNVCIAKSQSGYAKIIKNKNFRAASLFHDLNKTKDTLILKSDKKINYLYTANSNGKKDLNVRVDSNEYKLPLNRLEKGKNVLVAIQSPLRIVFVVQVLREIPILKEKAKKSDGYLDTKVTQRTH